MKLPPSDLHRITAQKRTIETGRTTRRGPTLPQGAPASIHPTRPTQIEPQSVEKVHKTHRYAPFDYPINNYESISYSQYFTQVTHPPLLRASFRQIFARLRPKTGANRRPGRIA